MSTKTKVFMEKWEKYPYFRLEKSNLSIAMVKITNRKFGINAYEILWTVEDYSDAQASSPAAL